MVSLDEVKNYFKVEKPEDTTVVTYNQQKGYPWRCVRQGLNSKDALKSLAKLEDDGYSIIVFGSNQSYYVLTSIALDRLTKQFHYDGLLPPKEAITKMVYAESQRIGEEQQIRFMNV